MFLSETQFDALEDPAKIDYIRNSCSETHRISMESIHAHPSCRKLHRQMSREICHLMLGIGFCKTRWISSDKYAIAQPHQDSNCELCQLWPTGVCPNRSVRVHCHIPLVDSGQYRARICRFNVNNEHANFAIISGMHGLGGAILARTSSFGRTLGIPTTLDVRILNPTVPPYIIRFILQNLNLPRQY
jgi:hypothetical protein